MTKVVYISDFDLRGSGYSNIGVSLCTGLINRGHTVWAVGMQYDGREHPYPISIIPCPDMKTGLRIVSGLNESVEPDVVVVALDIPFQSFFMDVREQVSKCPWVGIFPVESGPICATWAVSLSRLDRRLVMSRFGIQELNAVGVSSTFIPIGVDKNVWMPPKPGDRKKIRQAMGVEEDDFVVLTVADNHERKNLSRALDIFSDFCGMVDGKAIYWMVTRPDSMVGWRLGDYAAELGVFDRFQVWGRGVPTKSLWSLYAGCDAFLLTSKAEGLAMPLLEAMSMRVPTIGTDCSAIHEHLSGGRGCLIPYEYSMRDPWGNSTRYMASRDRGASALYDLCHMDKKRKASMLSRAKRYVDNRSPDMSVDILDLTIRSLTSVVLLDAGTGAGSHE